MIVTGLATKEAPAEQALRIFIERHRRKNAIADLAGIDWGRQPRGNALRPGGRQTVIVVHCRS
ncbi:type II toxin-antitoxin system VapB family antitoxin [Rhizobium aethiopicum]|uniref:type II toxin-antitoxin system VapB family antitoxin n=1 Tax=Rhizobium aethiopicum TaxID=1138170 RepID=UPI003CCA0818